MLLASLQGIAQQVSGKVTDANGPVEGVSIKEIDKIDRTLNEVTTNSAGIYIMPLRSNKNRLRIFKDGYKPVTENINGRMRVNITLTPHTQATINSLQTVKKARGYDTKNLLEGHGANGQSIEQWARIENFTDTSYIFAIALSVTSQAQSFLAGNKLLFVDIADRRILTAKCIADSHPVMSMETSPDLGDIIHGRKDSYMSGDLVAKMDSHTNTNQRYWLVPCFEISKKDLEVLYAKGRNIFRLALETPGGGGYWFVYLTEGWETEMRSLISRIQQGR